MAENAPPAGRAAVSQLLTRLVAEPPPDGRLTLQDLLTRAGRRGPAFLMLFLCLLSMIFSIVPGFSTIVGLPLLLLSAQMALGRRKLGLPAWLGRRSFDHTTLAQGMYKRLQWIKRAERIVRPRLKVFCTRAFLRVIGITGVICSIVLSLPIPLMNFPPTFAIFLMALGVLGKDGLMVLSGLLVAAAVVATLAVLAILVPEALAELWHFLGFDGGVSPPP